MLLPLSVSPFGKLPDQTAVEAWTLTGKTGLSLTVLTYGGIVSRLLAPDASGDLANVVIGHETLAGYLAQNRYYGAITGRVAGRITGAAFNLDGVTHRLAANDAPHHLHGGIRGFDQSVWDARSVTRADRAPSLRLSRLSPDGEEGYPGNLSVAVTYTLTDDHALVIDTVATTDRATPFSLTHHSYFNLAGSGSAADHTLQILADAYAPTDAFMGLLGRRESVTDANDFRSPRRLADAVPQLFNHHGDLYFLPPLAAAPGVLPIVAHLADPASGRVLTVRTTEACLQLYVGAALKPSAAGVCLECEGYPDGANSPTLGDIILRPGMTHRRTTVYAFSTL